MEHISKFIINIITRIKPLQPILIAAALIYGFTLWENEQIANDERVQQMLRDSYTKESVCQQELQELRMRIYNLELKLNELINK
jgi:hypothetical protein